MVAHLSQAERNYWNRSLREWFSSLPTVIILGLVLFMTSGELLHTRLLQVGGEIWGDYFALREPIVDPTCDPNMDVDTQVKKLTEESSQDDDLGLFDEPADPDAIRQSVIAAKKQCQTQWEHTETYKKQVTLGLKVYRTIETTISKLLSTDGGLTSYKRHLLILLIVICSATTTLTMHQIALRPIANRTDYYVSISAQLIGNLFLLASAIAYRNLEAKALSQGIAVQYFALHYLWIGGFLLFVFSNIYLLLKKPVNLPGGGTIGKALLTVPLFTFMAIAAGANFFAVGYSVGIGIYLGQMMELSDLFLKLALFIWIGMLLRQTQFANLLFGIFTPWKFSPEILCFAVLVVSAVPTAYTGASGIFVIAAGAVIYTQLTQAGVRGQLALAATAMSGAMGVVLRPCLLVVIIAALNKSVTTAELFHYGSYVFLLCATLFVTFAVLVREDPINIAPWREALPQMMSRLKALIPYFLIIIIVIYGFKFALGASLDEFTATLILPVIFLSIIFYEKVFKTTAEDKEHVAGVGGSMEESIRFATTETTTHIGALLTLMMLSVSLGGLIEKMHILEAVPETFPSIWVTMSLLVVLMFLIGMIMDPYGAVILVNASIAGIAYTNGVNPIHFWMITLVAFELGYLTPPVALNHLLTRQVVGEAAIAAAARPDAKFFKRHEKYLLPMLIMGSTLLLVAYVPLLLWY